MITELVLFNLPVGITRAQVVAGMHATAAAWRANPELVRKNYLYDAANRQAGGAYLWPSVEAAQRGTTPHGVHVSRKCTARSR